MQRIQAKIDDQLCSHNSKQETLVLNYFRDNMSSITQTSATQISDELYCSSTTISRTVKKLGFANYREFQMAINIFTSDTLVDSDYSKVYANFKHAIADTTCVYVYGKGADFIPSLHLFRGLITKEIDVSIVCFQDLLVNLRNKTLIVIVDHNCDDLLLELLKNNKENGCKILGISNYESNLSNITDDLLCFSNDNTLTFENNQQLIYSIDELLAHI